MTFDTEHLCGAKTSRGVNQTTESGKPFWAGDPRPEDVRIEDIAAQLSRICRFGGVLKEYVQIPRLVSAADLEDGIAPFKYRRLEIYSVAQHSVLVSQNVPPGFELAGLLHDSPEAYSGDRIKPQKVMDAAFHAALVARFGALAIAEVETFAPSRESRELDLEIAICERFGLPIGAFDSPEVKLADYCAVLTEKRDLLPWCPEVDWGTPLAEPWPERIVPVLPSAACTLFLNRFEELTK